VDNVWIWCGYDVDMVWIWCGYGVDMVWIRCGYGVNIYRAIRRGDRKRDQSVTTRLV
jgi:hypothetical protein